MGSRFTRHHYAFVSIVLALALAPLAGAALGPAGPDKGRPAHAAPAQPEAARPSVGAPTPSASATEASGGDASRHSARSEPLGARDRESSPKGRDRWSASAMNSHDLPSAAEHAYRTAARSIRTADPDCRMPWTLLAGVGRVESDHGRYGGSTLGTDGVSRPLIIGIALNGIGPVAAIPDSDNGRLDKDRVWDRAVGPMQFIPTTWADAGRDGDRDGVESPNDLDDAALAAAAYLCSGVGSILGEAAMSAAIFGYNHDDYYVALVMAFERGYRTGSFVLPEPPPPPKPDRVKRRDRKNRDDRENREKRDDRRGRHQKSDGSKSDTARKDAKPTAKPTARPTRKPTARPTRKPTVKPTARPTRKPTVKPTPKPPTPTQTPTEPEPTQTP